MKKTDIAIIIFIIGISAGIAYFVADKVFGGMTQDGVKVKTVDPITSTIAPVDKKIFNDNAINPSVEVNVTENGGATTVLDTTNPDADTATTPDTDTATP